MRTFYIFSINNEIKNLTKEKPYNLFITLDKINELMKNDVNTAYRLFNEIICYINKTNKNKYIYCKNKDNLFYTYVNNYHRIFDYYNDEQTNIKIENTYIKIITNVEIPNIIKDLATYDNLFACDFENEDYFWLKDIYNLSIA